jgi:hypothetical protein
VLDNSDFIDHLFDHLFEDLVGHLFDLLFELVVGQLVDDAVCCC